MTAHSSTKSLKASVASALALSALAATPAFAQANTSGSYIPSNADVSGLAVAAAPGNTQSLATFQAAITAAFSANTGGNANFDNLTTASVPGGFGNNNGNSFTVTYGTSGTNTLTISSPVIAAPGTNVPYSFNNNQPQTTAGGATTSGTVYLGTSGGSNPVVFNFSQNLSNFGIAILNRNAARAIDMTVFLSNGTTVTPDTAVATSTPTTGPVFFQYQPASGLSITGVSFINPGGFSRFDDLGFVVAPAAAPEPSQFAGLGLGVLGLGLLALRARKRTALGS